MSEPASADRLVEAIVEGRAPLNIRTAAARGALPLPRGTLVGLYVALLEDADEGVRKTAQASLDALDAEQTRSAVSDEACAPAALIYFAKRATRDEGLAERIAFHPAAPRAALTVLAATGSAAVIDLVLTNQQRLLRQPSILENIMINPALRPDQSARILELLERAAKLAEEAGEAATDVEGDTEAGAEEDLTELAQLLDVDVGDLLSVSEIQDAEEFEASDDPQIRSAFQVIVTLSAAQKAILALKGGREERMILIHDTNKVVALGVLKNPRIGDNEVEAIAKMRNVTSEVLRHVGATRDWTKSYSVVRALVWNPRTPQTVSTNFIPRLVNRDLKDLARSREVPELIRRMAKKTHDLRTQSRGNPWRK